MIKGFVSILVEGTDLKDEKQFVGEDILAVYSSFEKGLKKAAEVLKEKKEKGFNFEETGWGEWEDKKHDRYLKVVTYIVH